MNVPIEKKAIVDFFLKQSNMESIISRQDIFAGATIDKEDIELVKEYSSQFGFETKTFSVCSQSYNNKKYEVMIKTNEMTDNISGMGCNCIFFQANESCKHIAAVIINYYEMFFDIKLEPFKYENLSKYLLDKYAGKEKNIIKKEVKVQLSFSIKENDVYYYYNSSFYQFDFTLLVGESKMYKVGNKINRFRDIFEEQKGELNFGKEFTYNPEVHFFSEESKVLLEALFKLYGNNSYMTDKPIRRFLDTIKKCEFIINDYVNKGIKNNFPIETKLVKENDNYKLSFDMGDIERIFDDNEYIIYRGQLYHLNSKEQDLLDDLFDNNINELEIAKDDLTEFSSGLLSLLKKNIDIDESINEIVLTENVLCELYFDLRNKYILCNPKFKYDDIVVGYFDNNTNVVRDMDYETSVINDILKYGFIIEKEKLYLNDLEKEVEFLENGLEALAEKYVIFTTEKFKNINIKKKTNITSSFGIGQDNIFSFDFDLGNINSEELVNIFKDIKNKKKYYRLKNGDILNLEDENLKQLESLTEEMEFSDEDIINGKGKILKYRAIYLDSLKKNKYSIINTSNLFDEFIDNFYKYKDAQITIPKKELSILRDYQVTGVKWLYNLAKTGFGGILADEMGLGKTIQVIYYIKQILRDDANSKFLIVVPTSLAYNWEHEFDLFAPKIKKVICVGNKSNRKAILDNLDDHNVIITTYGLLREDIENYENLQFNTMIIDEAHTIKNNLAGVTKCVKSINADVKFALTGTPLENSVLELWSIFDYIMPGYLASLSKFQSKYKIKDYNEESEKLIKGLSRQINPFILRRKKSDVVKELPEKLINDIYIELGDEQKKLYVAELERVKKEMEEAMQSGGMSQVRFVILTLLTKLRQICIDPSIVYENYDQGSNKIDALCNTVNNYISNGHKILIFSSFRTGLNIVKKGLEKYDIDVYMIDGSVNSKKRMQYVNDFNNKDDVKVFLIMLKSGGTGLNLTSADVVIHLDLWWNPQAENQATDRTHRIGQTKTVEVIHFIMKGTIEEKILELQKKKQILSDKLIDGEVRDKNIVSELTEEDIRNLLSYENKE